VELLYQLGLALALLAASPLLIVRGSHYLATLRGRLTLTLPEGPVGALWLHAVSVGEVAVAAVLARGLRAELPLLVTTVTPTGQERASKVLGSRAGVGYLPVDLGLAVERFLRRLRPAALVLVEGDYWPLLLARCRRREMPIAVVNGRVGDRTFRLLRRRRRIAKWLMGTVERFAVQTPEDARRLQVLGIDAERITVTGNLKYEADEPARDPRLERELLALAAGRPLLVAGSTCAGEEPAVLAAFAAAGGGPRAMLVLAPRHPERWDEVARLLDASGVAWRRRSELGRLETTATERTGDAAIEGAQRTGGAVAVVLVDSLGELASLYRLGAATFVGGTLVPKGGHNPLEPARFGRAIAVGHSMHNFRDMAKEFDAAHAWRRVADAAELGATWRAWLEDDETASALGEKAKHLFEANRGALERTLAVLAPVLAHVSSARGGNAP
jgi:3-deoxy-D-manno-octulosonic-acid transferase